VYPLEDYRIEGQKQIEYAVHERHVDANSQDDRLREQKSQWARDVLLKQFTKINLDLFLLSMYAPISCASSELGGFIDKDYRWVCLFK
jgi:hypothetical protein